MDFAALIFAAVVVGTWNGEWFPSGRAEHRAHPAVEAATITAAGAMIRAGIAAQDPGGTNDLILCFNEIRDPEAAEALCAAIGRSNLTVAVVSRYRRRDRYDQQQDVIMTTLPVAFANWSWWKRTKTDQPPRGYAHAELVVTPAVTASVYAVHLKSNYGQTTAAIAESNRAKRRQAVEQLLAIEKPRRGKVRTPVLLLGDFNADPHWIADQELFAALEAAQFCDALFLLTPDQRVTHPGHGKFPDSQLDYLWFRDWSAKTRPTIEPANRLSDHNAVFVTLDL